MTAGGTSDGQDDRPSAEPRYTTGPVDDPARYSVTAEEMERVRVGGEGLLYRAVRTATGEPVALKLLTNTPMADFERVAERSALFTLLDDPGLMTQIETFTGAALADDAGRPGLEVEDFDILYSVAGWIEGSTLTEAAAASRPQQRLAWIADIADALAVLHAPSAGAPNGLVHRDVKPSNIRVRTDGHAVLVDFGVARQIGITDMTEGVGTFRWRAPEVLSGSRYASSQSVDTWGLGAVAHWLLWGGVPDLDGAAAAQERLAMCDALSRHPRGRAIAVHIASLLHTDPSKRPRDLRRWAAALRRMASGRRSIAEVAREVAVPITAVVVVISIGWGVYLAVRSPEAPAATTTVAGATTIVQPPAATSCGPITGAHLRVDPPAIPTPRTVNLSLEEPPPPVACTGPVDTSMVLESLTIALDDVTCSASPTSPGTGSARFRWPDGSVTDADIDVGPDPAGSLLVRIHSTSGFAQIDGTTALTYGDFVGSCDTGGITGVKLSTQPIEITMTWNGTRPGG